MGRIQGKMVAKTVGAERALAPGSLRAHRQWEWRGDRSGSGQIAGARGMIGSLLGSFSVARRAHPPALPLLLL